jgi:hypothetical protein
MIRPLKRPTRIVLGETETRSSRQALSNKAKPNVRLNNSSSTVGHPSSAKVPNKRRVVQKSSIESQAAVHIKAEKQPASTNLSSGRPKESEDIESKIRSALSCSIPRKDTSTPATAGSSRSVKFDPAILFCSHPTHKECATQSARVQASVRAILSCELNEQKVLHHFIKALIKHDGEKKVFGAKGDTTEGKLNPRASSFRTASSPRYQLPPTDLQPQQHASTPHPPLRRKFHPRPAVDPSTFDPRNSVRQEKSSLAQPSVSTPASNGIFSVSSKKSNCHLRPIENLPTPTSKKNIQSSFEKSRGPSIHESHTISPIEYQSLQLIDPPDESDPGREAHAIDPTWAQAILNNFVQKYPMTGLFAPGVAVITQRQRNAEVQQMLEFIIMRKKEMAALAGGLLDH